MPHLGLWNVFPVRHISMLLLAKVINVCPLSVRLILMLNMPSVRQVYSTSTWIHIPTKLANWPCQMVDETELTPAWINCNNWISRTFEKSIQVRNIPSTLKYTKILLTCVPTDVNLGVIVMNGWLSSPPTALTWNKWVKLVAGCNCESSLKSQEYDTVSP